MPFWKSRGNETRGLLQGCMCLFLFVCPETEPHQLACSVASLSSNSRESTCLCLQSANTKGMYHHTQTHRLFLFFLQKLYPLFSTDNIYLSLGCSGDQTKSLRSARHLAGMRWACHKCFALMKVGCLNRTQLNVITVAWISVCVTQGIREGISRERAVMNRKIFL